MENIEYPKVSNTGIWLKTKNGTPVKVTKTIDGSSEVPCRSGFVG